MLEVARQVEKILFLKAAIMAIVNTCKSQDTRTEDIKSHNDFGYCGIEEIVLLMGNRSRK